MQMVTSFWRSLLSQESHARNLFDVWADRRTQAICTNLNQITIKGLCAVIKKARENIIKPGIYSGFHYHLGMSIPQELPECGAFLLWFSPVTKLVRRLCTSFVHKNQARNGSKGILSLTRYLRVKHLQR